LGDDFLIFAVYQKFGGFMQVRVFILLLGLFLGGSSFAAGLLKTPYECKLTGGSLSAELNILQLSDPASTGASMTLFLPDRKAYSGLVTVNEKAVGTPKSTTYENKSSNFRLSLLRVEEGTGPVKKRVLASGKFVDPLTGTLEELQPRWFDCL
jgi:hypothetical protein